MQKGSAILIWTGGSYQQTQLLGQLKYKQVCHHHQMMSCDISQVGHLRKLTSVIYPDQPPTLQGEFYNQSDSADEGACLSYIYLALQGAGQFSCALVIFYSKIWFDLLCE